MGGWQQRTRKQVGEERKRKAGGLRTAGACLAGISLAGGAAWAALTGFTLPAQLNIDAFGTSYPGEVAGVQVGTALASIRDLNGDSYADLVIGAPNSPSDTRSGKIYIFFGKAGTTPSSWNRSISLTEADVTLSGEKNYDNAGTTVSGLGDVNGDGIHDLGIAAPGNGDGGTNAGKVYLVLGRKTGWPKTAALGTFADASFIGFTAERVGISLARAGDVQGSATGCCEDILIGSDNHTETGKTGAGRAFLVFGRSSGWTKNFKLTDTLGKTVTDTNVASYVGDVADQRVGKSVGGPVDLNRDGYADIVLGAGGDTAAGQNDRGQVGIIFGKSSGWARDASFAASTDVLIVGEQDGGGFGKSVAGVSSMDGDGWRELVVGAPDYDVDGSLSDAGKVYVFRGKGTIAWTKGLSLAASSADISFTGEAVYDRAGSTLAEAGDFNQDGVEDLLVGADQADSVIGNSDNAGRVYLVLGKASPSGIVSLKDAGVRFIGTSTSGRAGQGLAGRLDLDQDEYPDLVVGVPFADPSTGTNAGSVYLLRGAQFSDNDKDGYSIYAGDCDDASAALSPGITEIAYDGIDQDCSGSDLTDVDKDGYASTVVGGTDCNDSDALVSPAAKESCNLKDDNCNGSVDEGAQSTFYVDQDGDGYGNPDTSKVVKACTQPSGTVTNNRDCDDSLSTGASTYPGAPEVPYDGIDQDCSGGDLVDVDGDGEASVLVGGPDCDDGNPDINSDAIDQPYNGADEDCDGADRVDLDADGYAWEGTPGGEDCDDENAAIHPGVTDVPYNGIDEDCSGSDLIDVDQDGVVAVQAGGTDCLDTDPQSYPEAHDIPNDFVDQNCDGELAVDSDLDGFSVPDDNDCNDLDADVYPGAEEIPYDGQDQDCDGLDLVDMDSDGYESTAAGGTDCDDLDNTIHPNAVDQPYDGVDQDCDGILINDVDGDGFDAVEAQGTDCRDTDPDINPSATEILGNSEDENCNGVASDPDGDGFGTAPDDFGKAEDCDESDPEIFPGQEEVPYDEVDQDCSGQDLTDVDGDGFDGEAAGGADCDDENADVNPLMDENRDNGIDDNCDGIIDEEDVDGDGYTAAAGDCDDFAADVYPGATEIPGDEKDNDCNGRIDEHVVSGEALASGMGCAYVGGPGRTSGGESGGGSVWALGALCVGFWVKSRRVKPGPAGGRA